MTAYAEIKNMTAVIHHAGAPESMKFRRLSVVFSQSQNQDIHRANKDLCAWTRTKGTIPCGAMNVQDGGWGGMLAHHRPRVRMMVSRMSRC